jgi:hypothetical protein
VLYPTTNLQKVQGKMKLVKTLEGFHQQNAGENPTEKMIWFLKLIAHEKQKQDSQGTPWIKTNER